MTPIRSVNDFAHRLGLTASQLWELAEGIEDDDETHYRIRLERSKKKPDKVRELRVPKVALKQVQKKLHRLFSQIPLSDVAHGAVRGRSPRTNAAEHTAQDCLITMDVRAFFPSLRHHVIQNVLCKDLGWGRDVAWLATRLSTLDAQLPQGAPTSTSIANLVLHRRLDLQISAVAQQISARSTRFLDDLAFSGVDPRAAINPAARALSRVGLGIWRRGAKTAKKPKFRIMPSSGRQEVTGLIVNSRSGPSVRKAYRSAVRAEIWRLPDLSPADRARAVRSIEGKIAYVRECNPGSADRLQKYLDARRLTGPLGVKPVECA